MRWLYLFMATSMLLPMLNFPLPATNAQTVAATTPEPEQCTQSIDTVIVMDVSNSMGECTGTTLPVDLTGFGRVACELPTLGGTWSDTLLDPAKDLANYYVDLVDSVAPNDTIGLVSFASSASEEEALGDNGIAVSSAIAGLTSGDGATNMAAGINQALAMLAVDGQANADQKIIIFSDGEADDDIETAFAAAAEAGVKIYVFDMNTTAGDDTVLSSLATSTGGVYYDDTATTADLDDVYNSNKNIECPVTTGSLEICKYKDVTGDGKSDDDILYVDGWGMQIYTDDTSYVNATTSDDGCVTIDDLEAGTVNVVEATVDNWQLTDLYINNLQQDATDAMVDIIAGQTSSVDFYNYYQEPTPVVYCGNGQVDQEWEQCDGDTGCTEQCQWEQQDQCSDLVLARVNVTEFDNFDGAGDVSSDIYLGTSDYSIPSGTWFPLYWNGSYFTDLDIGNYENVPGLAVERLEGSIRLVLFGSTTNADKEHVNGNIELYNATVTNQRDDTSVNDIFSGKSNRLENDDDSSDHTIKGSMTLSAGNDEVWLESGNNTQSFFWLTTTTADDGYYTDWSITEDCGDVLTVCKNNTNGEPLSGWQMNVKSNSNLVENGGFETPIVTSNSARWELFNSSQTGWSTSWVNSDIDDEPVLELQTNNLWTPDEGSQYAELDTHYYNPVENPPRASVSISQDITTVPGNTYELSFAFSPRPGIVDNQLQVEFGDINQTVSADGSGNNNTDWTTYTYTFIATDNTTTLRFTDLGISDSLGTLLDDVQVYEIVSGITEDNGCYEFTELEYGNYTVTETMQDGWIQVTPESGYFNIDFNETNNAPAVTFVNEKEIVPGDNICGYKYEVNEQGEKLGVLSEWPMSLWSATEATSFTVDANDADGYTPDFTFESGKTYKIEVTGTAWAGDGIYFDAKYSERNDSGSWTDEVQNYETYGPTLLDLQINGISPDWGDYNSDHTYFVVKPGDDTAWNFAIYDVYYPNNEGSLSVTVYELTDTGVTEMTNTDGYYCFEDLSSGHYVVQEGNQDGYYAYGSEYCQVADSSQVDGDVCNFYNYQEPATTGIVTVCKYNDEDADGDPADDHPAISDWPMTIMQDDIDIVSGNTNDDGCVSFELDPGSYEVHEAMYEGWIQSYPTSDGGYDYFTVVVDAGSEQTVSFFNRQPNGGSGGPDGECTENCGSTSGGGGPTGTTGGSGSVALLGCIDIDLSPLSLNGVDPIVYNPGGQAKFQITINNTCPGTARNAVVTNTLPTGFRFRDSGVGIATVGGGVGMAGISSDGSRQDWNVGDVISGGSWSTTYIADIDPSVTAGNYVNIANVTIDGSGASAFDEDQEVVNVVDADVLGFEYTEPTTEPTVKVLGYEVLPETGGGEVSFVQSQTFPVVMAQDSKSSGFILLSLMMIMLGSVLFIKKAGYEA